eukprot:GHVP01039018.1.p1 GENE.GHVP01039018.1~~GHVP01039018.1.p1  ORF type:complete len:223 (-),score=30.11 GHVP01039018.1:54-722(-)
MSFFPVFINFQLFFIKIPNNMLLVKVAANQFKDELKSFKEIWYFHGLFATEESLVTNKIQNSLCTFGDKNVQAQHRKLLLRNEETPEDFHGFRKKNLKHQLNERYCSTLTFEGGELKFPKNSALVLGSSNGNIFYVLPDQYALSLRNKFFQNLFNLQVPTLAARTGRSNFKEAFSSVVFLALFSLAVELGLELGKPMASRRRRSSETKSSRRPSKSHSRCAK